MKSVSISLSEASTTKHGCDGDRESNSLQPSIRSCGNAHSQQNSKEAEGVRVKSDGVKMCWRGKGFPFSVEGKCI